MAVAIRCTFPGCSCNSFSAHGSQLRLCKGCKHGWVAHALDKLAVNGAYNLGPHVEQVTFNSVFDIASLMLYGSQAVPIRLKILLDRLFVTLQQDDVLQVLHTFGWSYEDYSRGYIIQDHTGKVIDKWTIVDKDEEYIVTQQFKRFTETKALAQDFAQQENQQEVRTPPKVESDIRKFMERNKLAKMQSYNLAMQQALVADPARFLAAFTPLTVPPPSIASVPIPPFSPHSGLGSPGEIRQESPPEISPRGSSPVNKSAVKRCSSSVEPFDLRTPRSPEIDHFLPNKQAKPSKSSAGPTTPSSVFQQAFGSQSSVGMGSKASSIYGDDMGALNLSKDSAAAAMVAAAAGISQQFKHSPGEVAVSSPVEAKGWPMRSQAMSSAASTPPFGSTVYVNASGKKRVLCTACNKTFCDKGALKIHFSAVHLKEMHRCTIPGCDMMFTSRRSRNRHSANPNPKLHTPHTKKSSRCSAPSGVNADSRGLGAAGLGGMSALSSPYLDSASPSQLAAFMKMEGEQHQMRYMIDEGDVELRDDMEEQVCMEEDDGCESIGSLKASSDDNHTSSRSKRKRLMPTKCLGAEGRSNRQHDEEMGDQEEYDREHNIDRLTADSQSSGCSSHGSQDDNEDGLSIDIKDNYNNHQDGTYSEEANDAEFEKCKFTINGENHTASGDGERKKDVPAEFYSPKFIMNRSMSKSTANDPPPIQALFKSFNKKPNSFWSKFTESKEKGYRAEDNELQKTKSLENGSEENSESLECRNCSMYFQDLSSLKKHFKEVHSQRHQCSINGCPSVFASEMDRDQHSSNMDAHRELIQANPNLLLLWEGKSVGDGMPKSLHVGIDGDGEDHYSRHSRNDVDKHSFLESENTQNSEGDSPSDGTQPPVYLASQKTILSSSN